jgi:nucleoside-diphosphate-sugar epimerase
MTGEKVLVTGAAGRIGSAVCPVLSERWDVVATSYFVANGVSANRYVHLELAFTTETLGYRPVDDAWVGLDAKP